MNTLAEKLVDAWKKRDLIKINSEELRKYSKIQATKKIYKILDEEIKKYIHSIQILIN